MTIVTELIRFMDEVAVDQREESRENNVARRRSDATRALSSPKNEDARSLEEDIKTGLDAILEDEILERMPLTSEQAAKVFSREFKDGVTVVIERVGHLYRVSTEPHNPYDITNVEPTVEVNGPLTYENIMEVNQPLHLTNGVQVNPNTAENRLGMATRWKGYVDNLVKIKLSSSQLNGQR